jgi:hypothetical protein
MASLAISTRGTVMVLLIVAVAAQVGASLYAWLSVQCTWTNPLIPLPLLAEGLRECNTAEPSSRAVIAHLRSACIGKEYDCSAAGPSRPLAVQHHIVATGRFLPH